MFQTGLMTVEEWREKRCKIREAIAFLNFIATATIAPSLEKIETAEKFGSATDKAIREPFCQPSSCAHFILTNHMNPLHVPDDYDEVPADPPRTAPNGDPVTTLVAKPEVVERNRLGYCAWTPPVNVPGPADEIEKSFGTFIQGAGLE